VHERSAPVAVFAGGGTGGHLYPALAIADALHALRPQVRLVFVGAEGGLEARVLPEQGREHLLLPVRALSRRSLFANVGVLRDLARSVSRCRAELRALRPGVVVVTGGYAGAPAGLAAVLGGRPLVLQEQNSIPGLTTRLLSRWASEIHVAFPEVGARLPEDRVRWSGNPIRPPRSVDRGVARATFGLPAEGRLLLVTGGSQGSAALNDRLVEVVLGIREGRLVRPDDLYILWQTGVNHLESVRERLGASVPDWLVLRAYLDDMPTAMGIADLAVSRSGAMTTSEFLAWGVPMVLVPLPTSAADHQARNAEALAAAGAAIHLPQATTDGATLWARAMELLDDPVRMEAARRAARERGRPDAARAIAAAVARFLDPDPVEGES